MASKKPVVLNDNGKFELLQAGDNLNAATTGVDVASGTNGNGSTIPPGTPVYWSDNDEFDKARANAAGTVNVAGLIRASVATGDPGEVQTDGIIVLSTAEWDAITGGTGGLVADTIYYLDAATAGKLTATPTTTTGQFVKQVGLAKSTTDMDISIMPDIKL